MQNVNKFCAKRNYKGTKSTDRTDNGTRTASLLFVHDPKTKTEENEANADADRAETAAKYGTQRGKIWAHAHG